MSPAIQLPSPAADGHGVRKYLVFFIPGSLGPVAYYRPFLSSLHASLNNEDRSTSSSSFEIYGRNLSEFSAKPSSASAPPSSSMEEQVHGAETALMEAVESSTETRPPKVVLVGHCAGAYIALELLKRWKHKPGSVADGDIGMDDDVGMDGDVGNNMRRKRFDVAGAVCLFPSVSINTVVGNVSQAMLSTLSNSAMLVHTSVKFLLLFVPSEAIQMLLRSTTGLSEDAAKITSEMIGSKWGIYQALKLWRSQMEDQKNGRWDDVIFASGSAASPPTYLLFGQNDGEPVVPRHCENKLEPVAGINTTQLPDHFFTTQEDSETVAGLVKEYVEEIVGLDGRQ